MEVVIPLVMLVIGAVIGFFVARYVFTKKGAVKASVAAEQAIKDLMAQQSQHHIYQVRQSVESIEQQCASLQQSLREYEDLLAEKDADKLPTVPFFGEQTSVYLRNNLQGAEKGQQHTNSDTQPRDFANQSSGLFVGNSEPSIAEKE